jgi:tetratricopeptide (TPR) repeat protein
MSQEAKMSKKFTAFFWIIIFSMVFHGEAFSQSLDIKQVSKSYIGQPIAFEVIGEITQEDRISFEWVFSDNVTSILISKGGRFCSFTALNTSPAALNIKAMDEDGKILSETFLMTAAREFDVDIRSMPVTMFQIWNPKTHMEEEIKEFAVNQRLSFEVFVSPDLNEKLYYNWRTSQGVSYDLSIGGKIISVWREEPGIFSVEVEIKNRNGILLGKGIAFEEIAISSNVINESKNRKKSWEKWNEALAIWTNSNFTSINGYEKAVDIASEALKINDDDPEVSRGVEKMKAENSLIQRAYKYALEGEEFRNRSKWAESLTSYRRSLAIWSFLETEKAISEIEEIVRTIRLKRDKATWLRDMAKAYEAEKRYEDVIRVYEESLLLDRQEEAIKGIDKAKILHENFRTVTALNSESEKLVLSGDYLAATNKYKESLALYNDDEIKSKLEDVEKLLFELRAKALQLKREGNEHAKRKHNAEALACYVESMCISADSATLELINKFEEIVPSEQRLPERVNASTSEEKNPEAARLLKEGTELYRVGNYNEALNRYKKSYEIEKNQLLKDWIERIEGSMRAQASIDESNRLIREGNALYSICRYKEALECYISSLELYPNKEIENFIKHVEEIINY